MSLVWGAAYELMGKASKDVQQQLKPGQGCMTSCLKASQMCEVAPRPLQQTRGAQEQYMQKRSNTCRNDRAMTLLGRHSKLILMMRYKGLLFITLYGDEVKHMSRVPSESGGVGERGGGGGGRGFLG